jgi:hypothetical protein
MYKAAVEVLEQLEEQQEQQCLIGLFILGQKVEPGQPKEVVVAVKEAEVEALLLVLRLPTT